MSDTSSHLREEHLRFLKEGVQFLERKEPELQELVSQLDFVKLQSIWDDNFNWAYLYELPTTQFFSIVFALLGWLPILAEAINSGVNPNQAVINQVNKMQEDPETFAKSLFNFEHEPATIEDLKKVRFNGIFTVSDFLILLYAVHLQGISLRKHGKLLTWTSPIYVDKYQCPNCCCSN